MHRWRPSGSVGLVLAVLLLGCPGGAWAEPAELLCARGIQRFQRGDLEAAEALLRRALDGNPRHLAAGHYLGLTLLRRGRLTEGRRVLARTAQLPGADARLLLDLGLAYLAEGNASWAARVLEKASALDPDDGRVRHSLGQAYLAMGAAEEARRQLMRARRARQSYGDRTALHLALAQVLSRKLPESREVLDPLLLGPEGRQARQLLRGSFEAEGIPASFLSARLEAGGLLDTNPLYEHEASGEPVAGLSLGGSLLLRPWVDSRHSVFGELEAARVFYFPLVRGGGAPTADDVASTQLRGVLGYGLYLGGGAASWQLGGSYAFDLVFLDGFDQLFADGTPPAADENHIFMERHGGHLTLERRDAVQGALRLRYSVERAVFAYYPRSHVGMGLSVEHVRSLWNDRLRLLGQIQLRYALADRDYYNAFAYGHAIGLSVLAPLGLVVGLRINYDFHYFPDSASGPWGKTRVDSRFSATAELSRSLPLGFRVYAAYQRDQRPSSIAAFDLARDLASLNLAWSYPP